MPIYEFTCKNCGHRFEVLVRSSTAAVCPACEGKDLEKLMSSFAVPTKTQNFPCNSCPSGRGDVCGPSGCPWAGK